MSSAPRVSFLTLGCRLNQHDTAAMRARLADAGWTQVDAPEGADVVVVNTCTVTARADQEARQLVRSLARRAPSARIVVTGCYAQRAPGEVAAIPGVSLVLGTAERERIELYVGAGSAAWKGAAAGALRRASRDAREGRSAFPGHASYLDEQLDAIPLHVGPGRAKRAFVASSPVAFGRTRALLKVQDGCDAFCSYCVVPYVRGRARSLPLDEAVAQGARLLEAGFHEIVVTGADLGSYGSDLGKPGLLAPLVERLLALGSAHRVRISSIEPEKVPAGLVEMIGSEERLCPHLHLPLQSGSDAILAAMRRRYRVRDYARLLERVTARGTVAIGADVIVGYPGEGDAEFEETGRFIDGAPLSYLHVFRYSARPGTSAAPLPAPMTARERAAELRALGLAKERAFYESLVGTTRSVLLEGRSDAASVRGRADVYAPVLVRSTPRWVGLARVVLREAGQDGCVGELATR
ncbi:MAG TPA: tRNA (N(6)-L-threonylcarbamoyladenosine(37)-C(2))-methylthiotransferase MtaB [Candidatus Eisenbacteria bacterium]|nr:tRNA (N(6)-L-threonylcarbamoyladenosine(37)-C(2))-methylthiotransferase MtaB [Candidatus Eisenbacteria bacterium]